MTLKHRTFRDSSVCEECVFASSNINRILSVTLRIARFGNSAVAIDSLLRVHEA